MVGVQRPGPSGDHSPGRSISFARHKAGGVNDYSVVTEQL